MTRHGRLGNNILNDRGVSSLRKYSRRNSTLIGWLITPIAGCKEGRCWRGQRDNIMVARALHQRSYVFPSCSHSVPYIIPNLGSRMCTQRCTCGRMVFYEHRARAPRLRDFGNTWYFLKRSRCKLARHCCLRSTVVREYINKYSRDNLRH